jgi:hypothetical protein
VSRKTLDFSRSSCWRKTEEVYGGGDNDITVSNPMRSGYVNELIDLSITAPVGGSGHAKFALPKDRR